MWAILGYVVLQLVFGVIVAGRVSDEDDYLLAGRRLGPFLSTASIFATWFGAETCIGAASQAYGDGLAATTADPFGYALCLLFMGLVFAAPLWREKLTTLADLFGRNYGVGVERVAALVMVPSSVLWAAAQIRAFGQILGSVSTLDLFWAISIAAAVVVIYTALGGLLADAMSDGVQGSVLVLGLVLVFFAFLMSGDVEVLSAIPTRKWSLRTEGQSALAMAETWAVPVLGSVVAQELVARVAAARSAVVARRAALTAAGLYLCVGLLPVLLGLGASAVLDGVVEPEQVLPRMAERYLPTPLYVVFVGALVSAILSTVDSALLVAGSLTAHNLILSLRPTTDAAMRVRINRIAVVAFGVIAYGLSLSAEGVYALVEEASALGTSGVLVCVVLALFTRLGGRWAALTALSLGLFVYGAAERWMHWPHPYLNSLAAALVGYVGVAQFEPRRPQVVSAEEGAAARAAVRRYNQGQNRQG